MATMDDAQVTVTVRGATGPRVGVAVLLRDDAKRILWQRRRGVGDGLWSVPGGAVEDNETPIEAARRELLEETGVEGWDFRPVGSWVFSPALSDGLAWITLYFTARFPPHAAKPRITEPSKCSAMEWRYSDEIPAPLFRPMVTFLAQGGDPWRVP